MKKLLFTLTMIGLLLPLAPRAQAATDVSLNFFYDNLSDQGSWIEVADYGYCFQPNVAVSNTDWRPYADGYWAYTDAGWTWVSYEDFGWATYHYGRWSNLDDYGWVWVPGYEWAPAWVSWRTGGDYVGWAPLPPTADRLYEGRAITGQVDVEFDIGPQYYNFVDVRYIGEPVLRGRIFEPSRNVTIINNTVNVTNITYSNSTVYNYGPNYDRLNSYSTRPIQRLSLQRETTVANISAQGGGQHNFNRVNGNQLMVVAPVIQKSPEKIAPRQVKAKVEQPKIEHGWRGISNREQLQAQMKNENSNNIPPPTVQPQKGRKAQTATNVQNGAARPNGSGVNQPNENSAVKENTRAAAQANDNRAADRGRLQAERTARQNRGQGQKQDINSEPRRANRAMQANPPENAPEDNGASAQPERIGQKNNRGDRRPNDRAGMPSARPDQNNNRPESAQPDQQPEQPAESRPPQPNPQQSERRNRREGRKTQQQNGNDSNGASPQKNLGRPGDDSNTPRKDRVPGTAQADQSQSADREAQPKRNHDVPNAAQDGAAERPNANRPDANARQQERNQSADAAPPSERRPEQKQAGNEKANAQRKAKKDKQNPDKPEQP